MTEVGIERARRPKGEMRTLTCPFFECLKEFAETGNLKTHLRTHVSDAFRSALFDILRDP